MASPNKFLICGLGSIGRRHVRLIRRQLPNANIAVLRSGLGSACEEEALVNSQFKCQEEALSWRPDAVIIASPASIHLQQALFFASHDIPLLIEKPLGTGFEPDHQFCQLAQDALKLPILIGYVLRHDQCLQWVKHQLELGSLGTLIEANFYCGSWLPDWRKGTDYRHGVSAQSKLGGGVLLELSHEIDLAFWLLSDSLLLQSVIVQQSGLLEIDVEDRAQISALTSTDVSVTFHLNFCTQPARRELLLRGTEAELHCDLLKGEAHYRSAAGQCNECSYLPQPDERYQRQFHHFLSCIEEKEKPVCTVFDGLNVLKLIQQIRIDLKD